MRIVVLTRVYLFPLTTVAKETLLAAEADLLYLLCVWSLTLGRGVSIQLTKTSLISPYHASAAGHIKVQLCTRRE